MIWEPKIAGPSYKIGKYTLIPIYSDRILDRNNPECKGWTIKLNEKRYKIVAVERHLPAFPIQIGEIIGIAVEPIVT